MIIKSNKIKIWRFLNPKKIFYNNILCGLTVYLKDLNRIAWFDSINPQTFYTINIKNKKLQLKTNVKQKRKLFQTGKLWRGMCQAAMCWKGSLRIRMQQRILWRRGIQRSRMWSQKEGMPNRVLEAATEIRLL